MVCPLFYVQEKPWSVPCFAALEKPWSVPYFGKNRGLSPILLLEKPWSVPYFAVLPCFTVLL